MTTFDKVLATISVTTDVAKLRQIHENALGQGAEASIVVEAATEKISALTGTEGELAEAFEAARKANVKLFRSDGRVSQMRSHRCVIEAATVLVERDRSGFDVCAAANRLDITYETFVVRFASHFPASTVAKAQGRLDAAAAD